MRLPGKHDVRFLGNIPSGETGNEGQRNRKRNRFHLAAWPNCWQIARGKETGRKRPLETKGQIFGAFVYRFMLRAIAILERILPR